ncbi:MAG TPA: EamA family transporter [Acetobacteraceae bacterium]|jgi:drug/metabolite transporter (DMT)-like permease|nr:EamA family transporter [Acetobacteraceae bacterium]
MFRSFWYSAWGLLVTANLFWAGNIVLARGLAGHVPPVALAYWRWTGAFLIAVGFAWPRLKTDLPVLWRHWKVMLVLSATGIASYNTMSYIGLNSTTALNVLLLQSATPLIIIVWAYLLFRETPTSRQALGVFVSLLGVGVIAAHGSLEVLAHLRLNRGDLWVLFALTVYGFYCVALRRRPAVHPLSFLVAAMGIGSLMMLPFMLWEFAAGARIEGGMPSYLGIAYTAVLPSFVAYLFFNRGVELIGSGPAGQSLHLMPLFGSVLAVIFLNERFQLYHAAGFAFIAAGILLASIGSVRRNNLLSKQKVT